VSPQAGTNEYEVDPDTTPRAVRNIFRLARLERCSYDPPLASICLPLFGAGRGGVDPRDSLAWIWAALERELSHDRWEVHLVTSKPHNIDLALWEPL
jgi:hypothetical protein